MKLVSLKCPNCGASVEIVDNKEKFICEYCKKTIIMKNDDILLKNVNIDGIQTNAELIVSANELLDMEEYLKAKKLFLEFTEKNPNDYQGWLGLLICRTRNFTIRDNNILFKNDIETYYKHFQSKAPDKIKKKYSDKIENYMNMEETNVNIKKEENFDFSAMRVVVTVLIILFITIFIIFASI